MNQNKVMQAMKLRKINSKILLNSHYMKYAETTDESWNADTTALRVTG